ncbi:His-Xaa-Ser system radical SAM maturase HxsC [Vibrio cincinnatiensis]|uniref:His-Xaa-Ser system radical SAM maturase HxsC n=1 Tax=Vibrio cincinnatiensis TaxID=675 RepID=UPI001EDCEE84|nr:His-Xaa-Ser system radical SAM maturase HxsC [Vibrio cincinnatiensis]MCG3727539.1 His-Xaa-Ser system radical SAM maturase HxsC [Vibrio cincinnatiensis]MCG3734555.1 His-Xaa-Ser system radical SAM maturase HxsC [Vibrio cincinnatiensis]MCG3741665.1 His-Xaa-Ser system radical SAM maturase HxsC [Vibrio cincinnatiensis]MCG3745281.1 His-Xaa-Ser system radical SAM maturase HxsC [Vibrio cincinnatiensis]
MRSLPLKISATCRNIRFPNILRVVSYQDVIASGYFGSDFCLIYESNGINMDGILAIGWGGIICQNDELLSTTHDLPVIYNLDLPEAVASGDIISISESRIDILYRKASNSNMLFVTERCNHNCIMCSQPPKDVDDSWRVEESKAIVSLMDDNESQILGISGGEPPILGESFVDLIKHCKDSIPSTYLHILTNGTSFSEKKYVERLCSLKHEKVIWGVPIFGSTPQLHDFHTQVEGSFDRTIHGLYNLALFNQVIELRVVLTKMVLQNIQDIAEFVQRNLPFVDSIALMGVEPTGYTRLNHQAVWCDINSYSEQLKHAVNHMRACSINVLLYNLPLCRLPEELHDIAVQSISDWKNVFLDDCSRCSKKGQCSGFFQSVNAKFVKKIVIPFMEKTEKVDDETRIF